MKLAMAGGDYIVNPVEKKVMRPLLVVNKLVSALKDDVKVDDDALTSGTMM